MQLQRLRLLQHLPPLLKQQLVPLLQPLLLPALPCRRLRLLLMRPALLPVPLLMLPKKLLKPLPLLLLQRSNFLNC